MADKKISQLTAATTPLAGTEVLPIVQGGSTVKVAVSNLTAGREVSLAGANSTENLRVSAGKGLAWAGNSGVYISPEDNAQGARIAAGGSFLLSVGGGNTVLTFDATTKNGTFSLGNLVVGTAGKGIDFSANTHAAGMTSELLNWYEEGTWTPTAVSTGGAITSFVSAATYTRVGRLVYINGYVQITNPGTASGGLVIDAIPYVNGNAGASGKGQQMSLVRESENSGQTYLGFMLSNSTQLRISSLAGGAVSWNANDQYSFSLCYYTA